jgi:hypothetical protein
MADRTAGVYFYAVNEMVASANMALACPLLTGGAIEAPPVRHGRTETPIFA